MDNIQLTRFKEALISNEKSQKTIEAYIRDVNQFYNFLSDNKIVDIHNEVLKEYKEYLLYTRFLTATTVNRKLAAINQFLSVNEITAKTTVVKVQNQNFLENVLDKSEVDKMVDCAKRHNDLRAVALFKTLELTGMRISEALSLKVKDIHSNAVDIIGKGNKHRTVFVPKALNKIWIQYCRNGRYPSTLDYLFVSQKGRITRRTADKIVKKYAEACNIPIEKAHCHSFRHLYCKRLGENPDISIDVIADLAGHQDISVTRRYLRKSKEELLNIIDELN